MLEKLCQRRALCRAFFRIGRNPRPRGLRVCDNFHDGRGLLTAHDT